MRNGTQSSRLTLIDRHGHEVPNTLEADEAFADETFAEYQVSPASHISQRHPAAPGVKRQRQRMAFVVVSAGCAAAAVATGSYALWLSRKKMDDEAFTSVHGLLETCRERVARMEQELSHLSNASSA